MPADLVFFRRKVLESFSSMSGLIIDLRNNTGGYDPIAVSIANHFLTQRRLYEESFLKEGTDLHIIEVLESEPGRIHFAGNVIILTGPLTMGVAEGFARLLKKEEHINTLGSWNTAGSFSLPGGQIKLGHGYKFNYPVGGSMDSSHRIIIETDHKGAGGVNPDIHIPPTRDIILQMQKGTDILLHEAISHIQINKL